jgi:hypothetical protein
MERPLSKAEVWTLTTRHPRYAELSPTAAKVLSVLFGAAGQPDRDLWQQAKFGGFRLSMTKLAERCGRALSTVRAAVAELIDPERCGWLTRRRTGRSSVFVLTLPGRVRIVADRQDPGDQTAERPAIRPPESERSTYQEPISGTSITEEESLEAARMAEAVELARERNARDPVAYARKVVQTTPVVRSKAGDRRRRAEAERRRLARLEAETAARRAAAACRPRIPSEAELVASYGEEAVTGVAGELAAASSWMRGGPDLGRPSIRAAIAARLEEAAP